MNDVASTPSIRGALCEADALRDGDRAAMFALLDAHFEGVDRAQFDADLAEKSHALLLCDGGDRLVGFSTLLRYATRGPDGEPLNVVCSGDTIVDPSSWHAAALPREWISGVRRLRESDPRGRWLWLLITSGFRTYRLLPTFWRDFTPSADASSEASLRPLLDRLARERFGDRYDAAAGIVRFDRPQRLRPHLSGVTPARSSDRHVAHFLKLNPGHAEGDELATLCDLDDSNLTRAGRRVVFGPPPPVPRARAT